MPRFSGNIPYQRLTKEWTDMPPSNNALTAAATVIASGILNFSAAGTIMRMIGEYIIAPTSAPTALDAANVNIGIGLVSSDAAAAGAGSLPDPAQEPSYPWLYWLDHAFFFADTGTDLNTLNLRHRFDIKSMRKFKPNMSLVMVAQYVNVTGNPPLQLNVAGTRVMIGTH